MIQVDFYELSVDFGEMDSFHFTHGVVFRGVDILEGKVPDTAYLIATGAVWLSFGVEIRNVENFKSAAYFEFVGDYLHCF